MPSIWERIGEGVGYALAAVVLGPPAAMARRERRVLRGAFAEWAAPFDATRLPGHTSGATRRLVPLAFPIDAELDPFRKRATLDLAIQKLPPQARATISKSAPIVSGRFVRYRMTPKLWAGLKPLAEVDGVRVDSESLDAATAEALAREIAATALAKLDAFILEMESERLLLQVLAPTTAAEWKSTADALVAFAESCTRRWGSSYR